MRICSLMGNAISIFILAAYSASAVSQAPTSVKTWTFALPHGSLSIELKSYSDGGVAIGIGPAQGYEAPIAEQLQALKKVLEEMPGLGFDPHKLDYISTRTYSRDVKQRLAYACADSREWRTSIQNHRWREKASLVVSLLNQTRVFEPYNEVFKTYGIQMRVTEAEITGLMYLSNVPARDNRDRANAKLGVPADVYIGMRFSPVDMGSQ